MREPSPAALRAWRDKIAAADGGCADDDLAVHEILGAEVTRSHGRMRFAIRRAAFYPWSSETWSALPRVTTDLEAALRLARLQLAGNWAILIEDHPGAGAVAAIRVDDHGDFIKPELRYDFAGSGKLARFVVVAMLDALAWEQAEAAAGEPGAAQ